MFEFCPLISYSFFTYQNAWIQKSVEISEYFLNNKAGSRVGTAIGWCMLQYVHGRCCSLQTLLRFSEVPYSSRAYAELMLKLHVALPDSYAALQTFPSFVITQPSTYKI